METAGKGFFKHMPPPPPKKVIYVEMNKTISAIEIIKTVAGRFGSKVYHSIFFMDLLNSFVYLNLNEHGKCITNLEKLLCSSQKAAELKFSLNLRTF